MQSQAGWSTGRNNGQQTSAAVSSMSDDTLHAAQSSEQNVLSLKKFARLFHLFLRVFPPFWPCCACSWVPVMPQTGPGTASMKGGFLLQRQLLMYCIMTWV